MKKLTAVFSMMLATVTLAGAVFAADSCSGKVSKVEGDKVTVAVQGAVPAWVQKGDSVSALGGSPKVLSVSGKDLVLKFNKAKAAKIKVDSNLTISKPAAEMQGC